MKKSKELMQEEELRECRAYCKCGHSIAFKASTPSTICSYCGHRVINNSKARFRYELINARRKLEGKNGK